MVDVLAIGPHPDDLELAVGGAVARFVGEKKSVAFLDLTAGERGTRGTVETRHQEAQKAAAVLGVSDRRCLNLPDGGVNARDPEQLESLVGAIREAKPHLILTLHGHDDHPDHQEGALLVQRASYLAGLRQYPKPGSVFHKAKAIWYGMGRKMFSPSFVVDITDVFDKKLEAAACFASQFDAGSTSDPQTPLTHPDFLPRFEARARTFGGAIGVRFGEPYWIDGPVALGTDATMGAFL